MGYLSRGNNRAVLLTKMETTHQLDIKMVSFESVNDRLKKKTILRNVSVYYSDAELLPPMTDQDNLEKMSVYSWVIKT